MGAAQVYALCFGYAKASQRQKGVGKKMGNIVTLLARPSDKRRFFGLSRPPKQKKHPNGCCCGGRERARTSDLYHVKVAL